MRWRLVLIGLIAMQQPLWDGCLEPTVQDITFEVMHVDLRDGPCDPDHDDGPACHVVHMQVTNLDATGVLWGSDWRATFDPGAARGSPYLQGPDKIAANATAAMALLVPAEHTARIAAVTYTPNGAVRTVQPHQYSGEGGT